MRFLRMRPAVCAMISCSFSSFTRKVAFGSNSVTTPGNSSSSSFAIRYPDVSTGGRDVPDIAAEIGAEPSGWRAAPQLACEQSPAHSRASGIQIPRSGTQQSQRGAHEQLSLVAGAPADEALANPLQKLVPNGPIGVE